MCIYYIYFGNIDIFNILVFIISVILSIMFNVYCAFFITCFIYVF